jgi:truncated hemoglobin YjbI
MPAQEKPTLYDRLGGVYNIATVVDDLIDRVMADPRLNANPRVDEAHHRVSPAGFKYLATEMVCWAAGGPQQYTGRSMGDLPPTSHDHRRRVAGVHGRPAADARQVPGAPAGARGAKGHRCTKEAIVVSPFQEGSASTTVG